MTKQLFIILYIMKNKNSIKSLSISKTFAKALKQNLLKLEKKIDYLTVLVNFRLLV